MPLVFEDWAAPDDRPTVLVTRMVRAPDGRKLRPGDRVTPRTARACGLPLVEAPEPRVAEK